MALHLFYHFTGRLCNPTFYFDIPKEKHSESEWEIRPNFERITSYNDPNSVEQLFRVCVFNI